MKQEDKELLLKDLCARLSYSVQIRIESYNIGVLKGIDGDIISTDKGINYPLKFVRPYLFPLSSMTEEQIEKLKEELCNMYDPYHDYDSYENWGVEVLKKHIHSDNYKFTFTADVVDWLNKNHFDYRGLIEKGLAIDATNMDVYK